ncbi:hypothetical protein DFH08DRAFT_1035110 [Mycena albidolilacea]|uniref:Uncharacterized protein n=1 Tax=Mycena albidolilacea TaxID=1033008 RepID=A0AAD6ZEV6_9AGAR|nr:hypothetical protein DFH08DRAFT_1035110 [Mycena albidolilacea]
MDHPPAWLLTYILFQQHPACGLYAMLSNLRVNTQHPTAATRSISGNNVSPNEGWAGVGGGWCSRSRIRLHWTRRLAAKARLRHVRFPESGFGSSVRIGPHVLPFSAISPRSAVGGMHVIAIIAIIGQYAVVRHTVRERFLEWTAGRVHDSYLGPNSTRDWKKLDTSCNASHNTSTGAVYLGCIPSRPPAPLPAQNSGSCRFPTTADERVGGGFAPWKLEANPDSLSLTFISYHIQVSSLAVKTRPDDGVPRGVAHQIELVDGYRWAELSWAALSPLSSILTSLPTGHPPYPRTPTVKACCPVSAQRLQTEPEREQTARVIPVSGRRPSLALVSRYPHQG